ncbi:MAG: hypothetical protein KF819_11980 [Labilithrix sp.]|nr:hypothetical protein [Labilithrix sp.]
MRTLTAVFALAGLVACGGSPSPIPEAPKVDAPPAGAGPAVQKDGAADDAAKKAAALEALSADEAKKGACDEGHKAALEKLLADVEAGMKAKNGDDGKPLGMTLIGKRVVPLGSARKEIEMAVTGRGTEVHVMAYAVKEVSLDVLVGNAAATTMRSPHQRSATSGALSIDVPKIGVVDDLQSDSRQVQIKPGEPIKIRLSGQGCAALVSFLKP